MYALLGILGLQCLRKSLEAEFRLMVRSRPFCKCVVQRAALDMDVLIPDYTAFVDEPLDCILRRSILERFSAEGSCRDSLSLPIPHAFQETIQDARSFLVEKFCAIVFDAVFFWYGLGKADYPD